MKWEDGLNLHKKSDPTLLERVCDFENLLLAHRECSRGKRKKLGYKESVFALGERLVELSHELRLGTYTWGNYRSFTVVDPKERQILAAPFMDRVVHHAIHRVIEPILNLKLSDSVFACRYGRGNRNAVLVTLKALRHFGRERFAVKLDVKKYFASIKHDLLLKKLQDSLPDQTLNSLMRQLLQSHPEFSNSGQGIPIGNLTSQLFANFYLASADRVATQWLGAPYYWLEEPLFSEPIKGFYIRYMDDMLCIAKSKNTALEAAYQIVDFCEKSLELSIPFQKIMPLGNDPIPFLGFVLSHNGYRPLSRNEQRFKKKIRRLISAQSSESKIAMATNSYCAWKALGAIEST